MSLLSYGLHVPKCAANIPKSPVSTNPVPSVKRSGVRYPDDIVISETDFPKSLLNNA